MKTDALNAVELRAAGYKALAGALGPLGMARFLRQFQQGHGNDTSERNAWLRHHEKNNLSNYGAGILAAGKALARRISAGSVTGEQRRQRPKEPAGMIELFFCDA